MPIPSLPTWQDCHELWSKRRRRHLREHPPAQEPAGGTASGAAGGQHSNTAAPTQPSQSQPVANSAGFRQHQ